MRITFDCPDEWKNELEKQARERKRIIRAYKTLSNNKKVEEFNNQIEAAKKQNADAAKARQENIDKKKQLFKELISE